MTYIVVATWDGNNRITADAGVVETEAEAVAKRDVLIAEGYANAFYAEHTEGTVAELVVDAVNETVTFDPPPEVKPTVITMDQFEGRFTATEWDDATDFVYETDTVTGKPNRRALLQGLNRATRDNKVDLLSAKTGAFMQALVDGGVISEARKAEILVP